MGEDYIRDGSYVRARHRHYCRVSAPLLPPPVALTPMCHCLRPSPALQAAVAEMIRSGITCYNDMYFFPHASCEVVRQTGIRAAIGLTVLEFPNPYTKDADDAFRKVRVSDACPTTLQSLPLSLQQSPSNAAVAPTVTRRNPSLTPLLCAD